MEWCLSFYQFGEGSRNMTEMMDEFLYVLDEPHELLYLAYFCSVWPVHHCLNLLGIHFDSLFLNYESQELEFFHCELHFSGLAYN